MQQNAPSPIVSADDASYIEIANQSDWNDFWSANSEALSDDIGDEEACIERARDGDLLIGGGAAPLFVVVLGADAEVSANAR